MDLHLRSLSENKRVCYVSLARIDKFQDMKSISNQTITPQTAVRKKSLYQILQSSTNFVHYTTLKSIGEPISTDLRHSLINPVINLVKNLEVCQTFNGFEKRVTAVDWHPSCSNKVAIGSKEGDIALWNFEKNLVETFQFQIGPGSSIQSLKFDIRYDGSKIFFICGDGTMGHQTFCGKKSIYIMSSNCYKHWYTSLDINFLDRAILVGDNKGTVNLLNLDGEKQWEKRLHKQKVTHIEYSPNESWCFVTTSIDKTIKVWDVRKISGINSYLQCDWHDMPVSCASFSRSNGGTLLTTDQHSQLRFYSVPGLILQRKVYHPHRRCQNMTPIKATWHPLVDLAMVGRYPDPAASHVNFYNSIDFFNSHTGELVYQHLDPGGSMYVLSLNHFNNHGDRLLSVGGPQVYISKPNFQPLQKKLLRERDQGDKHSCKGSDEETDKEIKGRKKKKQRKNKKKSEGT